MLVKIIFLLTFLTTVLYSQSRVNINIVDSGSSKPLKNVRGYILNTEYISGSDSTGKIIFDNVKDGYYTFYFTYIGYYPYTINLEINSQNTNYFVVKIPKAKYIKAES